MKQKKKYEAKMHIMKRRGYDNNINKQIRYKSITMALVNSEMGKRKEGNRRKKEEKPVLKSK